MYDAIYNKKKQITHSWLILNKEEKMCNQNKSKNEPQKIKITYTKNKIQNYKSEYINSTNSKIKKKTVYNL